MEFSDKCKIIEAIDNEVKILHPLLKNVLRHIEGVIEVEYTHGTNEKGADFIVTRFDEALNRNHHIGVVAKIGKILNNLGDIERQVEECQMPRKIQGGKSDARLSEVWVINTSTISHNAQDKISHKYSGQRVEFISGEKLTELVDKYAHFFWHDISSEIGSYLQDLSNKLEQRESELSMLSGLGCDNFYINPDVQQFEKPRYIKSNRPTKRNNVNIAEEVLREKVSVLEGDVGFGKSKTARHIAMLLLRARKIQTCGHNTYLRFF